MFEFIGSLNASLSKEVVEEFCLLKPDIQLARCFPFQSDAFHGAGGEPHRIAIAPCWVSPVPLHPAGVADLHSKQLRLYIKNR